MSNFGLKIVAFVLTALGLTGAIVVAYGQTRIVNSYQAHGVVAYEGKTNFAVKTNDIGQSGFGMVVLPDMTVSLRKPGTATTVATARTDLEGNFSLKETPEGKYDLCWSGPGWSEQCKGIAIVHHTFYANILYAVPDFKSVPTGSYPVVGDVHLADGDICRFSDAVRGIDITAHVQLVDGAVARPLKTVRANAFGKFAIPDVPNGVAGVAVKAICTDLPVERAKFSTDKWLTTFGSRAAVTGGLGVFNAADNTTPALPAIGGAPKHLLLAGIRPRTANFVTLDGSKHSVVRATAGQTIFASAPVLAVSAPVRFWLADAGSLSVVDDATVKWTLPNQPGDFLIAVEVADGKGGWMRQSRMIHITSDLGALFSGNVRTNDGGSLATANARVSVNGKAIALDSTSGFFYGEIAPVKDRRYTLNITADGYLPVSRVFHRESSGASYLLERVQTTTFNAGTTQVLSFPPPYSRQKFRQSRGDKDAMPATVAITGGSLRNAGGVYNGTATVSGALIDPSARPLPGDYDGKPDNSGKSQSLVSFGALYVQIKDSTGQPLQLVPGLPATVTIPLPADRNPATAPHTVPLWYYNTDTGYWEQDGTGVLTGNAYVGTVKHFSTINMDLGTVGNAVCIQVETDFLNTPQDRILRVTMTLPGGGTETKQAELDNELEAVYRVLPGQTVSFDLRRADGTSFPGFVLKDVRAGNTEIVSKSFATTAADQMAGVDLWPDPATSDISDCKPHILVTGNVPPLFTFLTRKGANDAAVLDPSPTGQAEAYYAIMDPNSTRTTFSGWLNVNGFQATSLGAGNGFTFDPAAQVISVAYLNNSDLGSGRKMHCRKDASRVACFVDNHDATNDGTTKFDRDPAAAVVAQAAHSGTGFATVAMEFSDVDGIANFDHYGPFPSTRVIKFFVYNQNGDRVRQAALDVTNSPRANPNVCMVCHGGNVPIQYDIHDSGGITTSTNLYPTSPAAAAALSAEEKKALVAAFKTQPSSFREFDLNNLINLQGLHAADKMRQLNCDYVRFTESNGEVNDIITAWYGPSCVSGGSPAQPEYFPPVATWPVGDQQIYHDVTSRVCRTCHIAQTGYEMTDSSGYPWSTMNSATPYTCISSMPQALVPFNTYWIEGMHAKVLTKYGHPASDHC